MSFSFTKFDDVHAYTLTVEDIEIDQLKELIETTVAANGLDLPLGKLATFGTVPSPPDPATGKGGGSLRWDGNDQLVTGIELDIDRGQMPLQEARDRLNAAGLVFALHTTKRHTPQAPRLKQRTRKWSAAWGSVSRWATTVYTRAAKKEGGLFTGPRHLSRRRYSGRGSAARSGSRPVIPAR
jgi:hypothetical protein